MIILSDANGWIVAECQAAATHLGLPALPGNPLQFGCWTTQTNCGVSGSLFALTRWRWMTSCIVGRNEWRSRAATGVVSTWRPVCFTSDGMYTDTCLQYYFCVGTMYPFAGPSGNRLSWRASFLLLLDKRKPIATVMKSPVRSRTNPADTLIERVVDVGGCLLQLFFSLCLL